MMILMECLKQNLNDYGKKNGTDLDKRKRKILTMNVVRQGVILIVYTFIIILVYIFLSEPAAQIISAIANAGSDISFMNSMETEIKAVLGICFAIAVIIPTILFIWMSYTNEEIIY